MLRDVEKRLVSLILGTLLYVKVKQCAPRTYCLGPRTRGPTHPSIPQVVASYLDALLVNNIPQQDDGDDGETEWEWLTPAVAGDPPDWAYCFIHGLSPAKVVVRTWPSQGLSQLTLVCCRLLKPCVKQYAQPGGSPATAVVLLFVVLFFFIHLGEQPFHALDLGALGILSTD